MQVIKNQKVAFCAASYVRLSIEDENSSNNYTKHESNSITNQKELIKNYVVNCPDIEIVKEFQDDGYSGVDFDRPSFLEMIEEAEKGTINCIIVKDLSRLGRNYIEAGRYIEQVFPSLNIRFISINENYDSNNKDSFNMTIPFLNLINDAYCRDISVKTRSSLLTKKKKGEYVGAFTPYGYIRDEKNPYYLVIDQNAAEVVRHIFQLRNEWN